MSEVIRIKKYSNRKYYSNGKYLRLAQIVELLKQGNDIEVINHKGVNVTNDTLKSALITRTFTNEELLGILC